MKSHARPILLAVVVAALFAAAWLLPVAEWVRLFQSWVAGKGAWGPILYGAVYVVAALLLVPGLVLTLGAGVLFGVVRGSVIVTLAANTAAALAFLIARYLARAHVEALARRNAKFAAVDAAIRERGWKVVLLLRLSPVVPFSLSNYLYGLTSVGFVPYVAASFIGMLPATVLYVYLGAAGGAVGQGRRTPAEWTLFVIGLLATAAATWMVGRAARRALSRQAP